MITVPFEYLRDIPLFRVFAALGVPGTREGTSVAYRNDPFDIITTGRVWHDHRASRSGFGAIELVCHLLGKSYSDACTWLADLAGSDEHLRVAAQRHSATRDDKHRVFGELLDQCARRASYNWPAARRYLTEVRGLDGRVVDRLYVAGTIYADDRGVVVFLHASKHGGILGASIRSIYSHFRQSIGATTNAWFTIGKLSTATRIVVTKSPIDALSFHQLDPRRDQVVVSVAGSHVPHPLLLMLAIRQDAEPVIALDNNPDGATGACKAARAWDLFSTGRHLTRLKPATADWNCDLMARTRRVPSKHGASAQGAQP